MRRQTFLCLPTGEHDSSACIRSDDHGLHWQRAGAAEFDFATSKILPSESSIAELPDGRVLLNTRNSCHRLPAPNNCCWGCGCCKMPRCPNAPMPAASTAESVRRLPRFHSRKLFGLLFRRLEGQGALLQPNPLRQQHAGQAQPHPHDLHGPGHVLLAAGALPCYARPGQGGLNGPRRYVPGNSSVWYMSDATRLDS